MRGRILLLILAVAPAVFTRVARGQIDDARFREDLTVIASHPSRVIGSAGYQQSAAYLEKQIASMPGVEMRKHEFPVMMPVTDSATIDLPGGKREEICPFWPAVVRVNSTPANGITGRLVYAGSGRLKNIRAAEMAGNIAVIESDADWRQMGYFGARAVIVLGSDGMTNTTLLTHDVPIPIDLPRFYIPSSQLADAMRNGRVNGDVTLRATVTWTRQTACNYYALIPPKDLSGPPGALMISVPYDSTCLVPDLAAGASQAVQAAAGLALLRDFAKNPPPRPVVVFFGGADGAQFQATRQMFMAFSDVPAYWTPQLVALAEKEKLVDDHIQRIDQIMDKPETIDTKRDRELIDRIVKIIETDAAIEQDELFRLRAIDAAKLTDDQKARKASLVERQTLFNQLRFDFLERPAALSRPDVRDVAKDYVRRTAVRLVGGSHSAGLRQQYAERRRAIEARVDLYTWLAGRIGRNPDPPPTSNGSRLIELLVALDLSDGGCRAGPVFYGQFARFSNISQIQDYVEWFARQERGASEKNPDAAWLTPIHHAIDFEPFNGTRAVTSWLCASMPIGSELCPVWGVPGFSMITLDDLRLRRDTPIDTLDRLNVDAILPQLHALREVFVHAWADPNFKSRGEFNWQRTAIEGQVVSQAPGRPVPDLPREGFLAVDHYLFPWGPWSGHSPVMWNQPMVGMRRGEVRQCDAEGNYLFEGLSRIAPHKIHGIGAYRIDLDGSISACTDLGKITGGGGFTIDVGQDPSPQRTLVFNCSQFTLFGLYDPRFLQSLGELQILDARRNADPQRQNVTIANEMLTGFVEPEAKSFLVFRYGRVGNRLLLLNMQADAAKSGRKASGDEAAKAADGFDVDQLNDLPPLSWVTAKDFFVLDSMRLADYRAAGVSSSLLDSLHGDAQKQIDRAADAYRGDSGAGVVREANGAWANEARVYSAAQNMASDVIHAAIFLLLLCVPFAFCMERLIVGSPSIYKQITGMFVIFGIMTLALWSFHPAFKISSSPLIIILAFAIILMSVVVISVVYGKFDTELKRIRSGRGAAETASFARASVLMSAVLLGIANMRKRRFRTMLTSVTIVLITFAVLCFTSASRYLDVSSVPTGEPSRHAGLMLRQRGFRPMPPTVVENVRAILGNDHKVVERVWNVDAIDPKNQFHVVASDGKSPARVFAAQAILGLTPGEADVSAIADVIGREKWERLENSEETFDWNIIYLAAPAAKQLQVKEGDTVRVGGMPLQVAGIFDVDAFDRKMTTLSGEPLAPLKYTPGELDAGGRPLDASNLESLDLDAQNSASEASGQYEHLSASEFVIVPARVARLMPSASLRSVAIRLKDDAEVKKVGDELARRFAVAIFAGYADGVKLLTAGNLSSVSGAGQVAIPLAIAGLIIFNTMMGSIAERRREIHVYTSLGLAPLHVGALFVAEAMTYGLIGTVFGYVIGQGAGTAMLKLGWLGNVTLNYSGTSAMLTMGLILLIVLLSALVPARLASKIAAPSIERSWKVPLPKGDEIRAVLPFTINKTAALGALAYLEEFFDAHKEGSIGKFSAGNIEAFSHEDDTGRSSRGLKTVIWLTPFDLGVRQHLMLLIHPGQFADIYEVQVVLQRLSGDDGSWYRMNRTFLTELRKQFLQWRSLTPQRMLEYVEQSKRVFAQSTATC